MINKVRSITVEESEFCHDTLRNAYPFHFSKLSIYIYIYIYIEGVLGWRCTDVIMICNESFNVTYFIYA